MENSPKTFLVEDNGRVGILAAVVSVIIIGLTVIPFVRNFKNNDNHLNWLNHDYAKNLMLSCEEDSVFMTEGGDNQVFGSLYFIYAEKLRPDMSPYDQMGNIFKRIYGDMRYVDGSIVDRRKKLVDTGLFDGQEPFYENYRSPADPYLIPYWQGRRPVYLTWQRPNQWTLGDVYYKRYGIMYRVQDIEYSLVDLLELKREMPLYEAVKFFSDSLKRDIDTAYAVNKINKLQKEGLVSFNGSSVRFSKMYPMPDVGSFENNRFDDKADNVESIYNIRWTQISNARYYDTLSREIIISYDFQMGEICKARIAELKEIRKRETRPEILAAIDRQIKENWELTKAYFKEAVHYGPDSLSSLYTIPMALINSDMEDMGPWIRELLTRSISLYKNFWAGYSVLFTYLINDCFKNPQNEAANVSEIQKWMAQLQKQLLYYRSSQGDYRKHQLWQNFDGIEKHMQMMKDLPTEKLNAMVQILESDIAKNPKNINNMIAQQSLVVLYSRGYGFQHRPYIDRADRLFDRIIAAKQDDSEFLQWAFQIAMQLNRLDLAYSLGSRSLAIAKGRPDSMLYYNLGLLAYQLGRSPDAKRNLQAFLDALKDDRMAVLEKRDQIEKAKQILGVIK